MTGEPVTEVHPKPETEVHPKPETEVHPKPETETKGTLRPTNVRGGY